MSWKTRFPFVGDAQVEVVHHPVAADAEYVFYALTPTRVLLVEKNELMKVLADVAPGELTLRETPVGQSAALASPLKLLGFAAGEELQDLA
ncbi:MAG: hypothetical protein DI536_19725 [Archangium gephyra]|uniref:Uncharacterized protein n=1 Tax=Archangium gephyra TaxID=48 RepID=A0A2W5TDI7_9BACT|nr:MAG: hypothetical protein DI536_19725 [Archangium gephyra]